MTFTWTPYPWAATAIWALPSLVAYGYITEEERHSMVCGIWEHGGVWKEDSA